MNYNCILFIVVFCFNVFFVESFKDPVGGVDYFSMTRAVVAYVDQSSPNIVSNTRALYSVRK